MLDRILKYPLLTITMALAIGLFIGSATAWIPPSITMLPTYFGLAFPLIALLNIVMGLYWMVKMKWYLAIPAISLLLCGHNLQKTIGLHNEKEYNDEKKLKILTYNVKLFNFYEKNTEILNYILKQDADIVCLQEFGYYTGDEKRFLNREKIMTTLKGKYPYHHFSQSDLQIKGTYGMATFSKHPLVKHQDIEVESRYKSAIYSDFKIGDDTIRVINLHLESNKLTSRDRQDLQTWQNYTLGDSTKKNMAKAINKKLSDAYNLREKQANIVAELIKETSLPIVLCGDINDAPVSYTYSKLVGSKLTDAFTEKGSGYGHTYNEGSIKFRIDYIMHSDEFKTYSYKKDNVTLSDHYPLVVELTKIKE